jgi:hypothetical protein
MDGTIIILIFYIVTMLLLAGIVAGALSLDREAMRRDQARHEAAARAWQARQAELDAERQMRLVVRQGVERMVQAARHGLQTGVPDRRDNP